MNHKIFVTRVFPGKGLDLLRKTKGFEVSVWEKPGIIPRAELLRRVQGCSAVLTLLTEKVDAAFLAAAGNRLAIVANYAVGFDNFDLAALRAKGVAATNTPLVLNDAVAEHTIALAFALAKRVVEADAFVRAGKYTGWEPDLLMGMQLAGKVFGVVGAGRIGADVAVRAKYMGMQIIYTSPSRNAELEKATGARRMPLATLLRRADIVSLHVPLLPETRHLMNAKTLKLMKKTALLINTARGPVVDEKALVRALREKRIAGAALDVFEFEPKVNPALFKMPQVILTPHTASSTFEAREAMGITAARNIIAVLQGKKPLTPVRVSK